MNIPEDVRRAGKDAVARYTKMLQNGESPRFAEMAALQCGPVLRTDTAMLAAMNRRRRGSTLADQFKGNENLLEHRIRMARQQGYNPRPNDYYDATLSRFPGDRRAYLGNTHTISDVRREMELTGDGMERDGSVIVKPRDDIEPEPPKKLAEDLVDELEAKLTAEDPDLKRMDRRELREKIKDEYGNPDGVD